MQPPTTPANPISGANRTRQDAARLGANHSILRAYAEAVRRMKALPSSDPRNWNAQATIHLQACPHGNWWFLPWHRAYTQRLEQICREMIGDEDFALPYWNWSRDGRIPPGFFDASSPLFQPGRLAGQNSTAAAEMVSAAAVERALAPTNFEVFGSGRAGGQRDQASQGPLEATPHNHIHVFVGGEMANFIAPVDPLFWLHHANVDRLWETWNQRGGRNPTDSLWRDLPFRDFVDRAGNRVTDTSGAVSSTAGLGYRYDGLSVAEAPGLAGLRATAQNFGGLAQPDLALVAVSDLNAAPVTAGRPHSLRARATPAVQSMARAAFAAPAGAEAMMAAPPPSSALANPERALIRVAQIDAPARNENVIVRVFVNHPNLTAATPVSDPHYVGSFGFFQTRFAAEVCSTNGLKASYLLDATEVLRRTGHAGATEADIQLMPVDVEGRPLAGTEFYAQQAEVLAV